MIGMAGCMTRLFRTNDGNVAVEFAFVAPILATFLWAGYDYGQVIQEKIRLTNAAAAGVQYAVQSTANAQDASAIQAAVRTAANDSVGAISVTASLACSCEDGSTIACSTGACASGLPIQQASVTLQENFAVSVPTPFFTAAVPLSVTASMRVLR
jgi:Flp pilus assembly protein TadG